MKASFEGHDKVIDVLLVGGAKPDSTGLVRCALSSAVVICKMCKSHHANLINGVLYLLNKLRKLKLDHIIVVMIPLL